MGPAAAVFEADFASVPMTSWVGRMALCIETSSVIGEPGLRGAGGFEGVVDRDR